MPSRRTEFGPATRWAHFPIVLQGGLRELVVVGMPAIAGQLTACAGNEPVRGAAVLQVVQCLASAGGAIVRQFGECLAQRSAPLPETARGSARRCADRVACCHATPRRKAGMKPPTARAPEAALFRLARAGTHSETRWRMSGACTGTTVGRLNTSSAAVREETLPYRLGGDTVFQEVDHRLARVELRDLAKPCGRVHCVQRRRGGPVSRSSGSLQASPGTPARFDRKVGRWWRDSGSWP